MEKKKPFKSRFQQPRSDYTFINASDKQKGLLGKRPAEMSESLLERNLKDKENGSDASLDYANVSVDEDQIERECFEMMEGETLEPPNL